MQKVFVFFAALAFVVFCTSNIAMAQDDMRVGKTVYTHATVGTTAADAILAASVCTGPLHFTICHDAADTPTFLAFGKAADPLTDGTRLAPGQCLKFTYTSAANLKALKVVGQAASTGYSIIQECQ